MRLLIAFIIALFLSSCSAEKLLQRAYKKDPSLFKQDTLFIPEIKIDTFYKLDTIEIKNDLDSILDSLDLPDTCKQEEIIRVITEYITAELISDTLIYDEIVTNDSFKVHLQLKVWQEKGKIMLTSVVLNSEVFSKPQVTIEDSYLNKKEEIIAAIIAALVLLILIRGYGRF